METATLVKNLDQRLQVSDSIAYDVIYGASGLSSHVEDASTTNTSQATWNMQIPKSTYIDPNVIVSAEYVIKVTSTCVSGNFAVSYGYTDALCSFPFHRSLTNFQYKINDCLSTVPTQEIIDELLYCVDRDDLNNLQELCPATNDTNYDYETQLTSNHNVLGGADDASYDNSKIGRGSFELMSIFKDLSGNALVSTAGENTAYIKFRTYEPLIGCPPFTWSSSKQRPCVTGINSLNFTANFKNYKKIWRWAEHAGITAKSCEIIAINDAKLYFQYLQPHSSMPMPIRNVVPYYTFSTMPSTRQVALGPGVESVITSPALTYNTIPDYLMISVRDPDTGLDGSYCESFLPITNLNLTWGIGNQLSTYIPQQLYQMSVRNGLNMNWDQFNGIANIGNGTAAGSAAGGVLQAILTGSILLLKFGVDISLKDFEAPGMLQSCSLTYKVSIKNKSSAVTMPANIAIDEVNLMTTVIYSGLMVSEEGKTTIVTAPLTAADVIKTVEQPSHYVYDDRKVGSGLFDKFNATKKLKSALNFAAEHPALQEKTVSSVLKQMGSSKNRFH